MPRSPPSIRWRPAWRKQSTPPGRSGLPKVKNGFAACSRIRRLGPIELLPAAVFYWPTRLRSAWLVVPRSKSWRKSIWSRIRPTPGTIAANSKDALRPTARFADWSPLGGCGMARSSMSARTQRRSPYRWIGPILRRHARGHHRSTSGRSCSARTRGVVANVIAHIPGGVFWKDRRSVYLGCNDLAARNAGSTPRRSSARPTWNWASTPPRPNSIASAIAGR